MKRRIPPSLVRFVALANAVVLAGGLIAYKCNAFELPWSPKEDEQLSGSKSIRLEMLPQDAPPPPTEPAMLPGSKFSWNFGADIVGKGPPPKEPAMLPGSKSLGNLGVGRLATTGLSPTTSTGR